jgi:hypothetical protein
MLGRNYPHLLVSIRPAPTRQYVKKRRPKVAAHIVGYQVVDHPTEGTILELAQQLFMKVNRMVELGLPPAA